MQGERCFPCRICFLRVHGSSSHWSLKSALEMHHRTAGRINWTFTSHFLNKYGYKVSYMHAQRVGVGKGFRLSPQPILSESNWVRELTPRCAHVLGRLHVAEDKLVLRGLFTQQVWAQGQLYACVSCRDWLGLSFKPPTALIRV